MTATIENLSFADPAVQLCPFHAYKKLHAEARVYRDPVTGFYEVSGFDDLSKIVMDPATFSSVHAIYADKSKLSPNPEVRRLLTEEGFPNLPTLINADEPAHRMYRKLVDTSFLPNRVKALEAHITELVTTLMDKFADRGTAEFVAEFATPLPLYVISDLIGVSRERAADFRVWSDAMINVHQPQITPERQIELTRQIVAMQQFFAAEFENAKANPGPNILGDLVRAQIEGRPVNPAEAVNLLTSVLVAGNETTNAALGSAMRRLIQTPGLEAQLRAEPEKIPAFIEETLRLDSPLQSQFRRNVKEVEIAGVTIPADSIIVLRLGAGNRDEQRFTRADEINLDRNRVRQHLAFGQGIHMCIGHLLARSELNISYRLLLGRLRNFRLTGEIKYEPSFIGYGPRVLPIAFEKA